MTPNERQLLQEGKPEDDGDLIKPIGTIRADFPAPILTIPGFSGSILTEGLVSILAGEGGVAKKHPGPGDSYNGQSPGRGNDEWTFTAYQNRQCALFEL